MKKPLMLIPAAFMLAVLAGLLALMVLPQNISYIEARDGVLDLRGEAAAGRIVPLGGQWEFAFGALLEPGELEGRQMGLINVPGTWDAQGHPLWGYATYRLTILTDEAGPMALFLPEIYSAHSLWVNGRLARSLGAVGTSRAAERFHLGNALLAVVAEDGAVELVFHVSNFNYLNAGIRNAIYFGESGVINTWFFRTRLLYGIALGFVLMAAFYHFTLYVFRREKTYLFFALLCLLCFLRFCMETNGLNGFFQWIPETLAGVRIFFVLMFAHGIAVFAFPMYLFNSGLLRRRRLVFGLAIGGLLLLSILMPINSPLYLPILSGVMMLFSMFAIVVAARSPLLKEDRMMRLYFASLVFFFVFGFAFVLFFRAELFMPGLLNNLFLIMAQSLVLSKRYSDAFRIAEEKREAERRLVAENAELDRANKLREEMMATISHEARTPLAVLASYSSLVALEMKEKNMGAPQVAADFDKIAHEAKRVANLIDRMKNLPLQKEKTAQRAEVDMGELVAQTTALYRQILARLGVSLFADIPADLPPALGCPEELTQVVFNLLQNAKNHSEAGGSIVVTLESMEGELRIAVADTGAGIEPELLPRVFERGVHGGSGGAGIGLALCKEIVEAHGGRIWIESELGKGTTVTFALPTSAEGAG